MIGQGKGYALKKGYIERGMGTIHGTGKRLDALIMGDYTDQNPQWRRKWGCSGLRKNPSAT
jgi:hypothetical protein